MKCLLSKSQNKIVCFINPRLPRSVKVTVTLGRSRVEAVSREVVSAQVLAGIIRRDIVNVGLITLFDVSEE